MRQFGTREFDRVYPPRPAAYVVIFNSENQLLTVRHRGMLFLPGGGIDPGETFANAAHREMTEELGWAIRLGPEIAVAAEYAYLPEEQRYVNKIGHFFVATIVSTEGAGTEPDHEPRWVSLAEFESAAAHGSQVWAARGALESYPEN